MCSHYESIKDPIQFSFEFDTDMPEGGKVDVWPCYPSTFIRRPALADVGDDAVPKREALLGLFGLVPHWAKEATFGRRTYNARTETVHEKPTFRDAWRKSQHCIIPAAAIYEPDWRSGKAKPTRIQRADGKPMGLAGLWAACRLPTGEEIHSFTMLTINADDHAFMCNFHKPEDEKRMVVILPENSYDNWLNAKPQERSTFIQQYPSESLIATL
jgi:putative SOS response-associated peptidase YedK